MILGVCPVSGLPDHGIPRPLANREPPLVYRMVQRGARADHGRTGPRGSGRGPDPEGRDGQLCHGIRCRPLAD